VAQQVRDRTLVIQLQQGDLQALGALYDRHRQLVYRTALGITADEEAAADLLQDVFLRLHRYARRIDPERPFEPLLYRVTTNLAYTWVRRRSIGLRLLREMGEWLTRERKPTLPQIAEADEAWQQVREAISALPLPQRVVLVLHYLNDLSVGEIAEILQVPEGTVKSRLHYGRRALKARLGLGKDLVPEAYYEFT
jgi:RNA polymerase sigma-70 factor (ECF subfamily)